MALEGKGPVFPCLASIAEMLSATPSPDCISLSVTQAEAAAEAAEAVERRCSAAHDPLIPFREVVRKITGPGQEIYIRGEDRFIWRLCDIEGE